MSVKPREEGRGVLGRGRMMGWDGCREHLVLVSPRGVDVLTPRTCDYVFNLKLNPGK